MRIGFCLPQLGPASTMPTVVRFAEDAERLGADGLWVQEHLVRPLHPETGYGGIPGAPWPDEHRNVMSPLELLAFVAARTSTCTVGTSVLVAGYHHPIQLAKQAATIDVLSAGRMVLGLGVGWCLDEYRMVGAPFEQRGSLADELLEAIHGCWHEGPAEYHGRHFDIPLCETSPRPVREDRVRTLGGFVSRAGWRRTARWCDGWQPYGLSPDEAVRGLGEINDLAHREYDRQPLEVSLRVSIAPVSPHLPDSDDMNLFPRSWTGTPATLARLVASARAAGCHELVLDASFAPGAGNAEYWVALPSVLTPLIDAAHSS